MILNANYENELKIKGYKFIAGVDEAGRGAWAGPIVAAAVIMPHDKIINGVRDSKLIVPTKREILCDEIKKNAICWAVGIVDIDFINKYNIGRANIKVIESAIENLDVKPDYALIDGLASRISADLPAQAVEDVKLKKDNYGRRDAINRVFTMAGGGMTRKYIKDGDAKIYSVAAASIIAKVTRDELLKKEHLRFPEYGFDRHKGYGTRFHQEALQKHGICPIHRVLYKPIKACII